MKQREIHILPYPFSDLKRQKVRPAVVISSDRTNASSEDVVIVPLTSNIQDMPYSVFITQQDLEKGKLIAPSRIRADKIFTVEKILSIKKIGLLKRTTFEKVKQEIIKLID